MTSRNQKKPLLTAVILLIAVIALFLWYRRSTLPAVKTPRNIIFISIDTCRSDYLSCYGFTQTTTPNIDTLAAHAMLFENVISPVPITLPAHSSMMTGTIPPRHGVHNNVRFKLSESNLTLAEVLKQNGFTTAAFVSAFVLDSQFGLNQGFDTYHDTFEKSRTNVFGSERYAEETAKLAVDWLGQNTQNPFFLFLHFYDPHDPYEPPPPFDKKFALNPYAGEIAYTDHCIGKVIEKLKELSLYDNSLIIIAGDHGEMLGEHGEETHMYFIYQSAIKVPLIFKLPYQKNPRKISSIAGLVDIVPTVCAILQIDCPRNIQGQDLSTLFKDTFAGSQRSIFTESLMPTRHMANSLLGIVTDQHKYIQTTRPELYDLTNDPQEEKNIAQTEPQLARILQDKLKQILEQAVQTNQPDSRIELDQEALARLAALGYVSGSVKEDFSFSQDADDPKDLIGFHVDFLKADSLAFEKKYDQAEKLYEKLLAQRPNLYETPLHWAMMAMQKKDFDKAEQLSRRALELNPELDSAYQNLGMIMAERKNYKQAEIYYAKAVELSPANSRAHNNLASAMFNQQLYEKAAEHYEIALKLNPKNIDALNNLALIKMRHQNHNEAIKLFKKTLQLEPGNITALNNLGFLFVEKEGFDQAVDCYKKSLQSDPDQVSILNNLAWLAATRKNNWLKPDQVVEMAIRVCELTDYKTPNALDTLAAAYAAAGKFPEAVETAQKALSLAQSVNDTERADEIKKHLQSYKNAQPLRQ